MAAASGSRTGRVGVRGSSSSYPRLTDDCGHWDRRGGEGDHVTPAPVTSRCSERDQESPDTSVRNCIARYGQFVAVFHWLTTRCKSRNVEPGTTYPP